MTYPTITHINDVLPHLAGRNEFVHAQRDGYSVIDYNFALADSFDDPVRLECRGIKFAPNGDILARPLHKFFNIGERSDTQPHVLEFSSPHVIMEKMDGSMVHPAMVNGEIVFMTRMGRTDVARKAERHLTDDVRIECSVLLENGVTPIFEFTAPDNRIVVRYQESCITLLALRETEYGHYMDIDSVSYWAHSMGVSAVPIRDIGHCGNASDFSAYARAVTGIEGFVVRFDSGLWVKAKGEDYVLKHKAKDSILQEKNVLALILSGGIDDVLPLLEDSDAVAVQNYRGAVMDGVLKTSDHLTRFVAANDNLTQKEFAISAIPTLPAHMRSLAYMVRGGASAIDVVTGSLLKATGSSAAVEANRPLHGAVFAL